MTNPQLVNTNGANILDLFGSAKSVPVFVSEGTSSEKLKAIYNSVYLAFAYSKIWQHNDSLVILGQGLEDSDKHIVDAVNATKKGQKNKPRSIAVGMLPTGDILARKAHYRQCFPAARLTYFDATTHPLGDPCLKVSP